MTLRQHSLASLLIVASFLVTACGMKGDLYLPDDAAAKESSTSSVDPERSRREQAK